MSIESAEKYRAGRIANLERETVELRRTIRELESEHKGPYGLSEDELSVTPTSDEDFIARIKPRMLQGRNV